jgi:hypothetical protein
LTISVKPINDAAMKPTRVAVFVKRMSALARNLLDREWRILGKKTKRRRSPVKNFQRRW